MSLVRFAARNWIAVVAVIVIGTAGLAVYRLNGIFGSNNQTSASNDRSNQIVQFNPKHVVLDVSGTPGSIASINYQDVSAQPQRSTNVMLPWKYEVTTTLTAVVASVVAQGNGDSITCRITIDGAVKDERTVNEVNAYTFCLDKSG